MASHISRILPLLFITVFCIAAVEGGYSLVEHFLLRPPAEADSGPAVPAGKGMAGPIPEGVRQDASIIMNRNLFGTVLKSEAASPAPVVEVAANPDRSDLNIVLVGTIGGSEGTQRAIILDKASRKQDLYGEGDEIKGATVKEIQRGKVILEVEGREELLDMSEAASVRPVARVPQGPLVPQQDPAMDQPVVITVPSFPEEVEGDPGVVEVDPGEMMEEPLDEIFPEETGPEGLAPEEMAPEAVPEAAPDLGPEAAPPAEEQPTERRIVRPRVIRPYQSS